MKGGGNNLGRMAVDENGNPFYLIEEQEKMKRLKGLDAHRANSMAAKAVAETIRTSLGPRGMDKIIVGQDGDVTVTNDGATILEKMDIEHPVAKLLVELSQSQDAEIGDGTTGIVVLAGALLVAAQKLMEKGIHPLRISRGLERACDVAVKRAEEIAVEIAGDIDVAATKAAATALGSKIVSSESGKLSRMVVDAVKFVTNEGTGEIDLDSINLVSKVGGKLEETQLLHGIAIDKDWSHPQMLKVVEDASVALLSCPFEPPKPKTKHKVDIKTADDYRKLAEQEQAYFTRQIEALKANGVNVAVCQWGFDDEANSLLYQHGIQAIRWVGGVELELLAIATGARIVPRFEELSKEKLGFAAKIEEVAFGTTREPMLFVEGCRNGKTCSILVRGGSRMAVDEAKRSIFDAMCAARNVIRHRKVVAGGGAAELACALAVTAASEKEVSAEQHTMRAFADALEQIPLTLAENSGLPPSGAVADAKALQRQSGCANHGIDCMHKGVTDMIEAEVHESLQSKRNQLRLATQVVKMIIKIDDVFRTDDMLE